jgi:plastocyanin
MSGPQVVAYAQTHFGERVGSGECFDLADQALRASGDKSAADFGTVTPNANYVWGTAQQLGQILPGDIVQFASYKMKIHTATTSTDGSSSTDDVEQERPHHTAVVETVGANGEVTVLEQNVEGDRTVLRNTLRFSAATSSSVSLQGSVSTTTTVTVTVSGTLKFYRPVART